MLGSAMVRFFSLGRSLNRTLPGRPGRHILRLDRPGQGAGSADFADVRVLEIEPSVHGPQYLSADLAFGVEPAQLLSLRPHQLPAEAEGVGDLLVDVLAEPGANPVQKILVQLAEGSAGTIIDLPVLDELVEPG